MDIKNPFKRKQKNTEELSERAMLKVKHDEIFKNEKKYRVLQTLIDNKELTTEDWHKKYNEQLDEKDRIQYSVFRKHIEGLGILIIQSNGDQFAKHKLTRYKPHDLLLSAISSRPKPYLNTFFPWLAWFVATFYIMGFMFERVFLIRFDYFAYVIWIILSLFLWFSDRAIVYD